MLIRQTTDGWASWAFDIVRVCARVYRPTGFEANKHGLALSVWIGCGERDAHLLRARRAQRLVRARVRRRVRPRLRLRISARCVAVRNCGGDLDGDCP